VSNEVSNLLFIVNKYSGKGFQPKVEGRIIDACEKHNAECTIEFTQGRGHATILAQHAVLSKKYQQVIAVGGDGTINEVARGLLHSNLPMGILPKGSGNGLARHLGIPLRLSSALKVLFDSKPLRIDTFEVNGKLSLNVSGIGFDGHVANLFGKRKRRGLRGYAKVTLGEFVQFKEFTAEITNENIITERKAFIIAIANSSQYGNNARIAPAASVCDELLHICFLKKVPPYRLDFMYSFFTGRIEDSSYCDIIEAKQFSIKVDSPIAYHIDGEPSGVDQKFDIKILPASLAMLVPPKSLKV
jgi:diacylglycerol kinase (ATP)